jgi:hypothetical protein
VSEPFVVTRGSGVPDRLLRLADVIITEPGSGSELAALLAGCPGLSLVLIVHADECDRSARSAAVALYRIWTGQLGAQDNGA